MMADKFPGRFMRNAGSRSQRHGGIAHAPSDPAYASVSQDINSTFWTPISHTTDAYIHRYCVII